MLNRFLLNVDQSLSEVMVTGARNYKTDFFGQVLDVEFDLSPEGRGGALPYEPVRDVPFFRV